MLLVCLVLVLEMSLNSIWLIGLRFVFEGFGGVRSEKYDSV
jgi:hypothetical protein